MIWIVPFAAGILCGACLAAFTGFLSIWTELKKIRADREAYQNFVERRNEFFARRDQFENSFRQVIREGIEKQVFRPVDVGIFTKTLLGAHNWVGVWYKPEGRLTGQQIAEMMADTFLRALKP